MLNDPNIVSVSLTEASRLLGISVALAGKLAKEQNQLCEGVPIMRFGRRIVVSARDIRAVLGWPEPTSN